MHMWVFIHYISIHMRVFILEKGFVIALTLILLVGFDVQNSLSVFCLRKFQNFENLCNWKWNLLWGRSI